MAALKDELTEIILNRHLFKVTIVGASSVNLEPWITSKCQPMLEYINKNYPQYKTKKFNHHIRVDLNSQQDAFDVLMEWRGTQKVHCVPYSPVLLNLLRKSVPKLQAYDVLGQQPINTPMMPIFGLLKQEPDGDNK
jgi:hypothetical protein